MSRAYDKHLPSVTALAESLAANRYMLQGAESGPLSKDTNAHRLLTSYAKRVAPKAYRKLTSSAYSTYLDMVRN